MTHLQCKKSIYKKYLKDLCHIIAFKRNQVTTIILIYC